MVLAPKFRYIKIMKIRTWLAGLAAVAGLAGTTLLALGEIRSNPYQSIIDRNAFALKPPPPPPDPAASLPPPPPPSNVKLTGITSMFGPSSKRAMLEILETGPGKLPKKPTLKEGEREGNVEVVSIDVEKGLVKILNNGVESVLGFTNDVAKATLPGAAGLPAHLSPIQSVNPGFPQPPAPAGGGNVAVPTPAAGGDSGRSKVAVSSGGTTTSTPNNYGAASGGTVSSGVTSSGFTAPGIAQPPGTFSGVNVSASGTPAANPGYNNIPSRTLRVPTTTTSTDGSAPVRPQYTREQIDAIIELQRLKNPGLPYPPTSINPNPAIVPQQ